jgi:hypothetical protein
MFVKLTLMAGATQGSRLVYHLWAKQWYTTCAVELIAYIACNTASCMRVFLFTDAGNSICFRVIHQCIWRFCCDTTDAGHVQKVRVHTSANAHFSSCPKLQSITVDAVAVIPISVQGLKFSRWCC